VRTSDWSYSPWEGVGSLSLDPVLARPTFAFANPERIPVEFDLNSPQPGKSPEQKSGSIRLNPYGPDEAVPPVTLAGAIAISSVVEPDPEYGGQLIEEVPLEVCKRDGEVVAARLGYLTWLLNDMRHLGVKKSAFKVEHGKWLRVATLELPSGHCIALEPIPRGERIPFEVRPGKYVAEVFTFDDPDLGYFTCDSGLRIRWVGEVAVLAV